MRFRVPASTSNLGHGFDCLGMALGIANTFDLEPLAAEPAADDSGLSRLRAAVRERCQQEFQQRLPALSIAINGDVPIARGLGSSATIIIAIAAAYQTLVGGRLERDQLVRIGYAIEGHPDNVAAAALGGFTVAADLGTAEAPDLRCLRFAAAPELRAVLVIPPYEVSTAEARTVLPHELSRVQAVCGWQRSSLITAALASGDCEALRQCFDGAWHESYRSHLNPLLADIRSVAGSGGALGTFLSGSGSSILSFCHHSQAPSVAQAISEHLQLAQPDAQVQVVTADNQGVVEVA